VEPCTCIADWTAVDSSDEENGGVFLVPNTQSSELQCPHEADPSVSFTREEVDIPLGLSSVPITLDSGDVLFFNGNVIHGSYPIQSETRFRRSFICHYTNTSSTGIRDYYKPLYRRDGTHVSTVDANTSGGQCGNEYK